VWGGAALVVVIVLIALVRQLWPSSEEVTARNHNRTWLEFAWTAEPVNQDAVEQLGKRLKSNEIDRVYLEAAAWRSDNTLIEGQHTSDFAQALRQTFPNLEILLWLRMSGEQIADAELRTLALNLVNKAVGEWNLDGVQINGRAIANGSDSYIQMLRDLRSTIGPESVLSLTVPPDRIPTDPAIPLGPPSDPALTWDMNFKQRIGLLLIDEIVLMAHASGLENSDEYRVWVSYQVESYVSALAELEDPIDVVVALPTYDSAPNHNPDIEDVRTAIDGAKDGVKGSNGAGDLVRGVGLFEYKTTDSLEWELYRQYWLEKK
jgi:hypothetical protein